MDALSEALQTVRLSAAIFYNAEYSAPWGDASPAAGDVAPTLAPGAEHLVIFHLVTEGHAVARMDGVADLELNAGDLLIIPQGERHWLSNGAPGDYAEGGQAIRKYLAGDLSVTHGGGGGELTRLVCGYFACDVQAKRLFLAGLPPMIRINVRGDTSGAWLESSIRHLVEESASDRPGRMVLLSKMSEALLVEALRRYMSELPEGETGWLAAARDPIVGTALALMHSRPNRHWTLPDLAAAAGTSRSVLSERFTHYLGESPISYLARARLQRAARLLQGGRKTVLEVAMDVGYESEAAFNRAFKREYGLPPAQYRRKMDALGGAAAMQAYGSRPTGLAG